LVVAVPEDLETKVAVAVAEKLCTHLLKHLLRLVQLKQSESVLVELQLQQLQTSQEIQVQAPAMTELLHVEEVVEVLVALPLAHQI
jgi:hypothetical protein